MPVFVTQYIAVLVVLAVVDGIWLGLIMRRFYAEQLGPLLREPVWWLPSVAFYFIYSAGLTIIAVAPADRGGGWMAAAMMGATLGFVAYATYDLTNLATIKGFPTLYAVVDIAWGTAMSAFTAAAAWSIARTIHG